MRDVMKCLIRISILIQVVRTGVNGVAVPQAYDVDHIHPRAGFFDLPDQKKQTPYTEGETSYRTVKGH